jgi:hypothetical protein
VRSGAVQPFGNVVVVDRGVVLRGDHGLRSVAGDDDIDHIAGKAVSMLDRIIEKSAETVETGGTSGGL